MTVVIALLGLSFLVIVHELGHMLMARAMGVRVTDFAVGFGPTILKKRFGKTEYSLRPILLGGFVKMAGMNDDSEGPDTYPAKAPWQRALIIFAGPFVNVVTAVFIFAGILMFSGVVTDVKPVVDGVERGSLASDVGIQRGDRLVAVDGESVDRWEGFTAAVGKKQPGDEIAVSVERDGSRETFTGELGADPADPERALVGVSPTVEKTTYGPFEALVRGVGITVQSVILYFNGMYQLVTGALPFFENVSGPVGIVGASSESISQGYYPYLLAFISLVLGITNLLPILPLDGGHLLFIAAEKIRGRPVSAETMGKVAAIGVALVLVVFMVATYSDLSKLFTGQPFIPK